MKTKDYIVLSFLVLVAACFLGYRIPFLEEKTGNDFMNYWAAGKAILTDVNPYSPEEIYKIERPVWHEETLKLPFMMYNPPITFSFAIPVSLADFRTSQQIWCTISIILIILSCFLCKHLFMTVEPRRFFSYFIIFFLVLFHPFLIALFPGQITPLLLIAFCLSIFFHRKQKYFLAGIFLAVTFIKPHILYLYYLVYFLTSRGHFIRSVMGCLVGVVVMSIPALIFEPNIYQIYFNTSRVPTFFHTPTIGSWLQFSFSTYEDFASPRDLCFRMAPTVLCMIVTTIYFIRKRNIDTETLYSVILPLSILTSPYGWTYDQMLVLPTIFYIFNYVAKCFEAKLFSKASIILAALCFASFSSLLGYFVVDGSHAHSIFSIFFILLTAILVKKWAADVHQQVTDC